MTPNINININNKNNTRKSELYSLPVFFLPKDLLEALVPEAPSSATDTSQLVLSNSTSFRPFHRKEDESSLYTHDTPSASSISSVPTAHVRLPISIPTHETSSQVKSTPVPPRVSAPSPSCRVCNVASFGSVQLHRDHAKSDWHRYNLKHSLLDKEGFHPISEQQFEDMLQHISSLSASGDDDYEESSDDIDQHHNMPAQSSMILYQSTHRHRHQGPMDQVHIQSLMQKLEVAVQQKVEFRNSDPVKVHLENVLEQKVQEARETPLIWFKAPDLYGSTVRLGVYKNTLFPRNESNELGRVMEALQEAQIERPPLPPKKLKMKRAARAAAAAAEKATRALKDGEEDIIELSLATEIQPAEDNQEKAAEEKTRSPRYWTMFLLGGGHFAGMVVDLAGEMPLHGQGKNQNPTPNMKIVAHKTFHRYTVRKKNGGAQGTHGGCNSAGARIRMYNETALKLEVRELVDSWKSWIEQSETVFLNAPGNNRKTFIHGDSLMAQVEKQGRVRSIPFVTRRPTLTELKRVFTELTTVKVERLDDNELELQERAGQEALENAFAASQSRFMVTLREMESDSDSASDDEEDSARLTILPSTLQEPVILERSAELQKWVEMVKKGRLEAMSSHLERHSGLLHPSRLLPQNPRNVDYDRRRTPTILHLAAHSGHPQLVQRLLERHGANPTVTVSSLVQQQINIYECNGTEPPSDSDGLFEPALLTPKSFSWTAYDVSKDKDTRDSFRRAMASLPDRWDWALKAHVPSALTPEMEAKAAVIAAAAVAEQEKRQTQETKKLKKSAVGSVNTLGSSILPASGSDNIESTLKAVRLSDEQRMRIDRERRAQAAEDRLAASRPCTLSGALFHKEDSFTLGTMAESISKE
ncbi:hypothetical protein EMPS_07154 [Entomortierella parvispora]|uniref:VLRF1 domain-containing protein n=1 Tax=Entomortierella parvispora TaxID=205924 RepID=A0A9P3HDL0_9FUNG|nr:hypothetical protein EMPS_07154 [Entomortierella parvispora]